MKKTMAFSFILFVFLSCEKQTIEPKATLNGEWRYVGKFNNVADYKCYICDDFDYEKAIYTLKISGDGTLTARINLLIAESKYVFQQTKVDLSPLKIENLILNSGSFSFKNFQILNKPWQTEADTNYLKFLDEVSRYQLKTTSGSQLYDELDLGSGDDYLKFVRKRQQKE